MTGAEYILASALARFDGRTWLSERGQRLTRRQRENLIAAGQARWHDLGEYERRALSIIKEKLDG